MVAATFARRHRADTGRGRSDGGRSREEAQAGATDGHRYTMMQFAGVAEMRAGAAPRFSSTGLIGGTGNSASRWQTRSDPGSQQTGRRRKNGTALGEHPLLAHERATPTKALPHPLTRQYRWNSGIGRGADWCAVSAGIDSTSI